MTDQDKIEELLENYRSLKSDIRTSIIEKCPNYDVPAIDYSKVSGGETNAIYSQVESKVTEVLDDKLELMRKIKARDIIYTAYINLPVEKKRITEYLYFEELSQPQTSIRMKLSERTIKSRKKEIIKDLKDNNILRAWKYFNCT